MCSQWFPKGWFIEIMVELLININPRNFGNSKWISWVGKSWGRVTKVHIRFKILQVFLVVSNSGNHWFSTAVFFHDWTLESPFKNYSNLSPALVIPTLCFEYSRVERYSRGWESLVGADEYTALSKQRGWGGGREIKQMLEIARHSYGGCIMNYKYFESTFVIMVLPLPWLPNLTRT